MNPYGRMSASYFARERLRQQSAQHVAAVERRDRNHVEDGQQHIQSASPATSSAAIGADTFGSPSASAKP